LLGETSIAASLAGYRELDAWVSTLEGASAELLFGIEGAGSWGAGLCEYLQAQGRAVLEVERPRRRERRAGKSDRVDALLVAKRVLAGDGTSTPRQQGVRRALAALLVAQRSATCERTRLLNALQALHATAPIALRERVGEGAGKFLEGRVAAMRGRTGAPVDERVILQVMRDLAARSRALAADARHCERQLTEIIASLDASLLDEVGVGPISAAKLLVCDPARFTSEAAFAKCNGTAPLPASSGKTVRHRLSRGGDRQVNNAIHTIALSRSVHDPVTRAYLDRRIKEGKTKREAMRALKRHLSRTLYKRLAQVPLTS
jgi:hypothetical protein